MSSLVWGVREFGEVRCVGKFPSEAEAKDFVEGVTEMGKKGSKGGKGGGKPGGGGRGGPKSGCR